MRIHTRAALAAASLTLMVGAIAFGAAGFGGSDGFGGAPAEAADAAMKLSPASQNVAVTASSFEVDVMAESGQAVGAFDFTITYDDDLIEFLNVVEGPFLGSDGQQTECFRGEGSQYPANSVNFGCLIPSGYTVGGPNGSGVVATLTFKPKAAGTSPLVYISPYGLAALDGQSINTDAGDGVIKIVNPGDEDGALAATPTVNPSARTPTGRPPSERDPFVRDGSSAATPVPGASTSGGTTGGGTPQSGTLSGQQSGAIRGQGSTSSGNAASGAASGATGPGGAPVAGSGYQVEERSPWWPALYAALALGAGALIGGVSLKKVKTR